MSSISNVEAERVLLEPAQGRIGRRPAVDVLLQARDGPVVDHLALLVAPRRVDDLADGDLAHVPRDDPIDEARRVAPRDPVLVEGRDVDQRRGVADRVVLVLVVRLVGGDGVVARPVAVVQALAERERLLVNGGSDRHTSTSSSRCRGRRLSVCSGASSNDRNRELDATTSSSSAAATTASSTPPIWRAPARRSSCSSAATCSAAPRSPRRSSPASSSPSARTSSRCCGPRSSGSSTCPATASRSCRSTAPSRRCRTATTSGASTTTPRRAGRSPATRRSTPRPTTSTARRWSRWAGSSSRSSR